MVNYFARNYSPATAERAARLFLDLCGEAGIETASQPRKRDVVSNEENMARSSSARRTKQGNGQSQGQESSDSGSSGPSSPTDGGPRIDIRINSQDLANMDANQIAAMFEGLSKLWPHSPGDSAANDEEKEQPSSVKQSLTSEALKLVESVDNGGIPLTMNHNIRRIAEEHGIEIGESATPNEVIDQLRALR